MCVWLSRTCSFMRDRSCASKPHPYAQMWPPGWREKTFVSIHSKNLGVEALRNEICCLPSCCDVACESPTLVAERFSDRMDRRRHWCLSEGICKTMLQHAPIKIEVIYKIAGDVWRESNTDLSFIRRAARPCTWTMKFSAHGFAPV